MAAVAAVGVGVAERAWFVFHRPVNSDEAIVGLMAREILHGHFYAFYWGQVYGGGEPYLVAFFFAIFGSNPWALETTAMVLSVAAAILTWRIAEHLVADRAVAILSGAAVWAGTESSVSNSTIELGFRGLTLVCGLVLTLLALRILDGRANLITLFGLGLAAGVGWWSSPEIAYFAIPTVFLLIGAVVKDKRPRRVSIWATRMFVAALSTAAGALPWLWNNATTGLKSLRAKAFVLPPHPLDYEARLHAFFVYSLPILFDLRRTGSGKWIWAPRTSITVLVILLVLVVGALVACASRGGRYLALVVGVVAFPFVLAISPATWYWRDGRYAGFLVPLLVLAVASGANGVGPMLFRRRSPAQRPGTTGRAVFTAATAAVVAFCALNFLTTNVPRGSYFAGWTDPNAPAERTASGLERAGVRDGYADYWVAYELDFLSGERLLITTAGHDPDRWQALNKIVLSSRRTTWLFVRPTRAAQDEFAGTRLIRGPGGLKRSAFVAELARLGVGYSFFDAGVVRAVTPRRAVLPNEVGLG